MVKGEVSWPPPCCWCCCSLWALLPRLDGEPEAGRWEGAGLVVPPPPKKRCAGVVLWLWLWRVVGMAWLEERALRGVAAVLGPPLFTPTRWWLLSGPEAELPRALKLPLGGWLVVVVVVPAWAALLPLLTIQPACGGERGGAGKGCVCNFQEQLQQRWLAGVGCTSHKLGRILMWDDTIQFL